MNQISNRIELLPAGFEWQAAKDETLLVSALNNNIALEHSCGTGQCGACKTKVMAGSIRFDDRYSVLSDEERADGVVLSCTAVAQSNVTIQAEYYPVLAAIVKHTVPLSRR